MLHCDAKKTPASCVFAAPTHCPHCGDWLVAPVNSEFVDASEIRHHWECECCGKSSTTSIPLRGD